VTVRDSAVGRPATGTALTWVLCLAGAGLLIASGIIHLHLWDIAYRHVKTLDVLFPVQAGASLLAAVALLALRRAIVAAAAALLMAGTIAGFLLARTVGIFGFKLTFSSGLAYAALIVEAAAVITLLLAALALHRPVTDRAHVAGQR
jgi:hypothetical protein